MMWLLFDFDFVADAVVLLLMLLLMMLMLLMIWMLRLLFLLALFMLIVLVLLCSHLKSADCPYNLTLVCKYLL
jgi:hypothetical protein